MWTQETDPRGSAQTRSVPKKPRCRCKWRITGHAGRRFRVCRDESRSVRSVDRCREASVGSRSRGKTAWRRNKHRAPYTNIAEQATEFERLARPTARLDPQVGRKIKSLKNEGHEEHEGKAQRYSLRVARTAPRGSPRRPGDCGAQRLAPSAPKRRGPGVRRDDGERIYGVFAGRPALFASTQRRCRPRRARPACEPASRHRRSDAQLRESASQAAGSTQQHKERSRPAAPCMRRNAHPRCGVAEVA